MAGYYGYSKSNNAIDAEERGLVVASKITKAWLQAHGITETVKTVKYMISKGFLSATEWNHTSKFYNETDYYDGEDLREQLTDRFGDEALPVFRAEAVKPKAERLDRYDVLMTIVSIREENK